MLSKLHVILIYLECQTKVYKKHQMPVVRSDI